MFASVQNLAARIGFWQTAKFSECPFFAQALLSERMRMELNKSLRLRPDRRIFKDQHLSLPPSEDALRMSSAANATIPLQLSARRRYLRRISLSVQQIIGNLRLQNETDAKTSTDLSQHGIDHVVNFLKSGKHFSDRDAFFKENK
ncbi:hypothetical protein AVEN_224193-1 [Araneus ventricosus]|uniref:Uncharacterized protein n=1 Tax=Araneus ventricosus TaxID=182803 RepID=A0A4Y2EJN3_ARAVE|nr:hypothetical protein AVEN_224193-1 [Araneus ventricosus]